MVGMSDENAWIWWLLLSFGMFSHWLFLEILAWLTKAGEISCLRKFTSRATVD
jgi:hypothetical protein